MIWFSAREGDGHHWDSATIIAKAKYFRTCHIFTNYNQVVNALAKIMKILDYFWNNENSNFEKKN